MKISQEVFQEMKQKILRTKTILYLALVLMTGIFARLSFGFYEDDLAAMLRPQIVRTMVKTSQIIPQLEENEQAVLDIYENLEQNSHEVYLPLDKEGYPTGAEEKEVVERTFSWMNLVTKLRLGREGHVIVASREDYSILAHPEGRYVGQKLRVFGNSKIDAVDLSDMREFDEVLAEEYIPAEIHVFFPSSIFGMGIGHILDALDAGVIGSVFTYKGTCILCGVSLGEGITYVVVRCFFSTLFFFVIAWVIVRYIGFALRWRKDDKMAFCRKLAFFCAAGTVVLFLLTWYYQVIMDMTGDLNAANRYARSAVDTLDIYEGYGKELSEWLDEYYIEECRMAAEMVRIRGRENITREILARYAKKLGVEYIYLFDKDGKVEVTNSPYDHFRISHNEAAQSYAFNALLEGREYMIQDVQEDDTSGKRMQYVGVSLRDEEDLADGFVQIAINPELRDWLLTPINLQAVLYNIVAGLPDYAVAIDKESLKITDAAGLDVMGTGIKDLSFDTGEITDGYNVECFIDGDTYYSGVGESDNLYLIPLIRSTDSADALMVALKMALLCAIACLVIFCIASAGYGEVLTGAESEAGGKDEADSVKNCGFFHLVRDFIKGKENNDPAFEKRWRNQSSIPIEEQTPEMRTTRIIYDLLLVFFSALILFEILLASMGAKADDLTGFSYVIMGKWERGVNIFSVSFCMFLLCLLYVLRALINQVLYRIARMSDLRHETILLMLRNALRYCCAIIFLYVGLAQFGIDTRALWASAGVLSLMVGFGAKDLVSDIIAGLFIIFEGTMKIGDYITVGSWNGMVQKIGIRSTRIENDSDTKIFNNSSLRDIIKPSGEAAREVLKLPIPYEADLLEIEKLLDKELPLIEERLSDILNSVKYQGIGSFEDSCIMLRFSLSADADTSGKALRELRREIKLLFDREHITIPYNHVVVKPYDAGEGTYVYKPEEENEKAGH